MAVAECVLVCFAVVDLIISHNTPLVVCAVAAWEYPFAACLEDLFRDECLRVFFCIFCHLSLIPPFDTRAAISYQSCGHSANRAADVEIVIANKSRSSVHMHLHLHRSTCSHVVCMGKRYRERSLEKV